MQQLVSVLLPVYNCEEYLAEAIESILKQSYRCLEIIILDDCSSDRSPKVYSSFLDPRIRIIRFPENMGLARILNWGVEHAAGVYIARMDSDDISDPQRIEKQVKYLECRQDISFVGSYALCVDEKGNNIKTKYKPVRPFTLSFYARFSNPIIHPSLMARRSVFVENSYPDWRRGQDYGFIAILIRNGYKGGNIPEPLLRYRLIDQKAKKKINGYGRFQARRVVRGRAVSLISWSDLEDRYGGRPTALLKLQDEFCMVAQKMTLFFETLTLKVMKQWHK